MVRHGPENPAGMVDVLTATLQKGQNTLAELGAVQDGTRLRLAAQASGTAVFEWRVAEGAIAWDGATDILPFTREAAHAAAFLDAIDRDKRGALEALLDSHSPRIAPFSIEI